MFFFFCLFLSLILHVSSSSTFFPPSAVLPTECGPVQGIIATTPRGRNVTAYLGIRYGTAQRWQPPLSLVQANQCWGNSTVYNANNFGSVCPQGRGDGTESEDCLFLNVWQPADLKPGEKLPVLFYIHGGGLTDGSGSDFGNRVDEVAAALRVIGVSINYRLNAFGFLALPVLTKHFTPFTPPAPAISPAQTVPASGNYGFMDQILALVWTQNNILAFGGDPTRVTIAGQSSGGTSIFALMNAPQAQGLFAAAWSMSASYVFDATLQDAQDTNMIFQQSAGCISGNSETDYKCLMNLNMTQVGNAVPYDVSPYWSSGPLNDFPIPGVKCGGIAIIDGNVVPTSPNAGFLLKVPIVIGTMAQENDLGPAFDVSNDTQVQLDTYIQQRFQPWDNTGELGKAVVQLYQQLVGENSQLQALTINADQAVGCGNTDVARISSISNENIFRYVEISGPDHPICDTHHNKNTSVGFTCPSYAFHTFDFQCMFDKYLDGDDKHCNHLGQMLRALLSEFMTYGQFPLSNWPAITPDPLLANVALIGANLTSSIFDIDPEYNVKRCHLFFNPKYGLYDYGWIN